MALTKAELVASIAAMSGVSKAVVNEVINYLAIEVHNQLVAGDSVFLPGIGKLEPVAKPERMARNPATGAQIQVPAKTTVKFTAAKFLKDSLN